MKSVEYKLGRALVKSEESKLTILGQVDGQDAYEQMEPLLSPIAQKVTDIFYLNVVELEFMNSSGIKALVTFVLGRKQPSKIVIEYDPDKLWQSTSFSVISSLDPDNVTLAAVGQA